ncbi:UNVERIFIED_CONTAM: hypothetical protein FKN15_021141 [Acipenser sinensis]
MYSGPCLFYQTDPVKSDPSMIQHHQRVWVSLGNSFDVCVFPCSDGGMAGRRRGRELLGDGGGSPREAGRGRQAAGSPRAGRGEAAGSPRAGRGEAAGSPRAGRGEAAAGSVQQDMLEKARDLFQLCDKEEKGFITKRDMQHLCDKEMLSELDRDSEEDDNDADPDYHESPCEESEDASTDSNKTTSLPASDDVAESSAMQVIFLSKIRGACLCGECDE